MRKGKLISVMLLVIAICLGVAAIGGGCDKKTSVTRIELVLVDPITQKTYASSRNSDVRITVKAEEFEGFELKYRRQGEDTYLPDKKLSLEFLQSKTIYYEYDGCVGTQIDSIVWPKEKGEYSYGIEFNSTYRDQKTLVWVNSNNSYTTIEYGVHLTIV